MQKLRVIASPGHLVADDVAYQGGARFRFVGRSPSPAKCRNPENLEERFPPKEVEYEDDGARRFVRRALQKGALLPCDETTAKLAGVKFDPTLVARVKGSAGAAPEPEKKSQTKAAPRAGKDGDA